MTTVTQFPPSSAAVTLPAVSNWAVGRGNLTVTSNQVFGDSVGAAHWDHWSAGVNAFGTSQFSQATVNSLSATDIGGVCVFSNNTGPTCYYFACHTSFICVGRFFGGTATNIATWSTAIATGSVLRLEVTVTGGTTANLTCKLNGNPVTGGTFGSGTVTDTNILSGQPGIFNEATATGIDTWSGGDMIQYPLPGWSKQTFVTETVHQF